MWQKINLSVEWCSTSSNRYRFSFASVSLLKEVTYLLTYSVALLCAPLLGGAGVVARPPVLYWAAFLSNTCKLVTQCCAQCGHMESKSTRILKPETHSDIMIQPHQNVPLLHLLFFIQNTDAQRHRKMTKHESSMTSADSNPSKCLLSSYNIQAPSSSKINSIKTQTTHYRLVTHHKYRLPIKRRLNFHLVFDSLNPCISELKMLGFPA